MESLKSLLQRITTVFFYFILSSFYKAIYKGRQPKLPRYTIVLRNTVCMQLNIYVFIVGV